MTVELYVNRNEALRYMRMGGADPDAVVQSRLEKVEKAVLAACRPVSYWRLEPLTWHGEDDFSLGPIRIRSRALGMALAGCRHAFAFCATLGAGVDDLLRRYSQTSAADVLMAQGVAASLIETYCDLCGEKLLEESGIKGESLRMRFSPGYGDLPLELQKELLGLLDSHRRAGIVLTGDNLMIPSKSVSAIIGSGAKR